MNEENKPTHRSLVFPQRTPEEEKAWLERIFEADDSNVSVGGLYLEIAKSMTLNDFVAQPGFPQQYIASFDRGDTEIWYRKNSLSDRSDPNDMPFLKPRVSRISELEKTHALIGKVAETHRETIFHMMQGENWQPMGSPPGSPAAMFLGLRGAEHSSMSIGDVIKIGDKAWMCMSTSWLEMEP